ncbi:uncharacterized protein LOC126922095 isoform X3 [Bombus affinis]|uniref:uncharacterized protein LOC126922095 isoform X3 n=1 Tax=Bombus affinis TaxID=309941 RepID=UPI0021B7C417|nr:uncharacterized protein LOC126922095 isoform X3 [Bombus affinis]
MPHCTDNFVWYLSKFIVGFTGMLFFYVVFLKEREYSCLCKPRARELLRRKGEKRSDRCDCREGAQIKTYACGCKKRLDMV